MKTFGEMTILEMCEWHMANGAPDGRSIRNLCGVVKEHQRELEGLDHATVAILEEIDTGYARRRVHALDTYYRYQAWAREQLGGSYD